MDLNKKVNTCRANTVTLQLNDNDGNFFDVLSCVLEYVTIVAFKCLWNPNNRTIVYNIFSGNISSYKIVVEKYVKFT